MREQSYDGAMHADPEPASLGHIIEQLMIDLNASGSAVLLPSTGLRRHLVLTPAPGTKLSRLALLTSDIARELQAFDWQATIDSQACTIELELTISTFE